VRRRLQLLVLATTSAVVLAFLVPLALLLRTLAEDRAIAAATVQANSLAAEVSTDPNPDPDRLRLLVDRAAATTGTPVTVVLPDGSTIGDPSVKNSEIAQAVNGAAFTQRGGKEAVVYVPATTSDGTIVVRVRVPESLLHQGVDRATLTIAALGIGLLAAAVLVADQVARRVSAPILRLATAAEFMRQGRLETRAPEEGPPEVLALAQAVNGLAERVLELLSTERDAVADLSHRLRTPVTALRLDVDMVRDPEVGERLRAHLAHLERTVDAVVHDARRPVLADLTALSNISQVVSERVAFWSALAEEQERPLRVTLPRIPVTARIEASDLADVLDVLIDNVFAYTEDGVPLDLTVAAEPGGGASLTVEDGGPGLPNTDVVERGSSGAGSSGLGLDIARRAAHASGGRLELGKSRLGGALIRVVFGPARR
jgi:signal transduction histidine kinase